jgi:hypothetical protein
MKGRIVHPGRACGPCLAAGAPLYHYTDVIEYIYDGLECCQVSIAHGCEHQPGVVPSEAALACPDAPCWTTPGLP